MLRPQKRRGHPSPLGRPKEGGAPGRPWLPSLSGPRGSTRGRARVRSNRRSKPSAPPAARRRPQAPSRLEREHFARGRPPERDESAVWPPVRTWTRRRLSRANSPRPRPRVAFARAVELRLRRGWRTIRNAPRRRQPPEWSTSGGREGVRHAPGLEAARDADDPQAAPGARKPPARLRQRQAPDVRDYADRRAGAAAWEAGMAGAGGAPSVVKVTGEGERRPTRFGARSSRYREGRSSSRRRGGRRRRTRHPELIEIGGEATRADHREGNPGGELKAAPVHVPSAAGGPAPRWPKTTTTLSAPSHCGDPWPGCRPCRCTSPASRRESAPPSPSGHRGLSVHQVAGGAQRRVDGGDLGASPSWPSDALSRGARSPASMRCTPHRLSRAPPLSSLRRLLPRSPVAVPMLGLHHSDTSSFADDFIAKEGTPPRLPPTSSAQAPHRRCRPRSHRLPAPRSRS